MPLCRANGCGCTVPVAGLYCEDCQKWGPLCPVCSGFYAEHRTDCTVADGYNDSGEGPWDTREAAEEYARAEVGIPWQVEQGQQGGFYVMVKHDDDN